MWVKIMRGWLVGAAVTMAVPGDSARSELVPSSEDGARSRDGDIEGDKGLLQAGWHGEPRVASLLMDPIVQALMARDGVTEESLSRLILDVGTKLKTPP